MIVSEVTFYFSYVRGIGLASSESVAMLLLLLLASASSEECDNQCGSAEGWCGQMRHINGSVLRCADSTRYIIAHCIFVYC